MRKYLILGAAIAALGLFAMSAPADAAIRKTSGVTAGQTVQMDLSARRYYRHYYYHRHYRYYGRYHYYRRYYAGPTIIIPTPIIGPALTTTGTTPTIIDGRASISASAGERNERPAECGGPFCF